MKLLGVVLLLATAAFITRLATKTNHNINPVTTEITVVTNSTLTVNNVNPGFPTDEK